MTLNEVWDMSYEEYVQYLLKKYGPAIYDYFYINRNGNLSKNNKVTRSKEGLECHHIDEDKYILLSTPHMAASYPIELQKADRLIYADRIEHLLLHIKIARLGTAGTYGCGTAFLIGSINKIFQNPPQSGWEVNMYNKIVDYYDVYIEILYRLANEMCYGSVQNICDILNGDKDKITESRAKVMSVIFHKDVNDRNMETPIKIMQSFVNHISQEDYKFE